MLNAVASRSNNRDVFLLDWVTAAADVAIRRRTISHGIEMKNDHERGVKNCMLYFNVCGEAHPIERNKKIYIEKKNEKSIFLMIFNITYYYLLLVLQMKSIIANCSIGNKPFLFFELKFECKQPFVLTPWSSHSRGASLRECGGSWSPFYSWWIPPESLTSNARMEIANYNNFDLMANCCREHSAASSFWNLIFVMHSARTVCTIRKLQMLGLW